MTRIINYFSTWDFSRWFRFAAAVLMLSGAVIYMQFLPVVIGGIFLYQAFTNTGCCNGGNCEVPSSSRSKIKDKN